MWILIIFGVVIVLLTVLVVVGYYIVAQKYYWLQGNPSKREGTGKRQRENEKRE